MKNLKKLFITAAILIIAQAIKAQINYAVGTSNVSVAVSKMGAAVSSLPIYCPPARAGKVPQLAFTFNSQGGDGLMGKGFNLEGLSAISRIGKNYHLDAAEQENVKLNNRDLFSYDGARMILISGVYGARGSTYRTEQDAFVLITLTETGFKVDTKDGSTLFYGGNGNSSFFPINSSVAITYYLWRSYDMNGNYIEYNYTNTNGEILLNQVLYGGFDASCNNTKTATIRTLGSSPFNKVLFTYENTPNTNMRFVAGYKMKSTQRLKKAEVFSDLTNKVREYSLTYTNNGLQSFVDSITEKNGANEQYYPIKYNWEEGGEGSIVSSPIGTYLKTKRTGDFNGDGKTDVLLINGRLNKITGELLGAGNQFEIKNIDPSTGGLSFNKIKFGFLPVNDISEILVGDLNQDGVDDLVFQTTVFNISQKNGSCWGTDYEWWQQTRWETKYVAWISTGSGFTQINDYFPPYVYEPDRDYMNADHRRLWVNITSSLCEIDGDGRPDLVSHSFMNYLITNKNSCGHVTNVHPNPNGTGETVIFANLSSQKFASHVYFSTPNLTGKYNHFQLIDFNGNGKTDVLITEGDYFTRVFEYDSVLNVLNLITPVMGFPTGWHQYLQAGDFNGDGISDLLYFVDNKWMIGYGTGLGYEEHDATPWFSHNFNNDYCKENECYLGFQFMVLDVNGDGKDDIIEKHQHGQGQNGSHSADAHYVYYSKGFGFIKVAKPNFPVLLPVPGNALSTSCSDNSFLVGDFNGDGIREIMYGSDRYNTNWTHDNYFIYYNTHHKKLTQIAPKLDLNNANANIRYNISYKPLTQTGQYQKNSAGTSNEVWKVVFPLNIVENLAYTAGNLPTKNIKYYYSNLLMHRHGRGLMGFMQTAEVEQHSNKEKKTTIISEYEQNKDYRYILDFKRKTTYRTSQDNNGFISATDKITSTEYIYASKITTYTKKTFFVHPTWQIDIDYLSTARKVTCFQFDINGNLTKQQEKYDVYNIGNTLELVSTKVIRYGRANTWLPASPVQINTYQLRDNKGFPMPYYNTLTKLSYDLNGNLFEKIENDLSKRFEYDEYGNLAKEYYFNAKTNAIEKPIVYAYTNGRFLRTITNPLGQTSTFEYEPMYGNLLYEKDIKNLTTHYEYNNWGALTKTIMPNGNWKEKVVNWGKDPGIQYETIESNNLGESKTTHYNYFAKPAKELSLGYNGVNLLKYYLYNHDYELGTESNTHNPSDPSSLKLTNYTYDQYGRLETTNYNGVLMGRVEYLGLKTSTYDGKGRRKITEKGPSGHVISIVDQSGNEIKYNLGSHNLPLSTVAGTTISNEYDQKLQRTKLCDPNTGCITYQYDKWGNLTSQTDAKGQTYQMEYDAVDRLIKKKLVGKSEEYIYAYYNTNNPTAANGELNQLKSEMLYVNAILKHKVNYLYRSDNGLLEKTEELAPDGKTYTVNHQYDAVGRIAKINYPNIELNYSYDVHNNMYEITDGNSKSIWKLSSELPDGQTEAYEYGNGHTRIYTFDGHLQKKGIKDEHVGLGVTALDYTYNYELTTGNMLSRKCNKYNLNEVFQYDELDRLTYGDINNNVISNWQEYEANGNIKLKWDAGEIKYNSSKPHAVAYHDIGIGVAAPFVPTEIQEEQEITYTAFDKIEKLYQDKPNGTFRREINFTYGVNQQRTQMEVKSYGTLINKVIYIGTANMEIVDGRELTYVYADGHAIAMHEKTVAETESMYYLHTDIQGSLMAITDQDGYFLEEKSYDAWGRLRYASNWTYIAPNPFGTVSLTMRGYTFHEHLDEFGLINMNGRMYDPILGRMLNPDRMVPDATNFQSFNQYSYVFNNPLKYTDPDGHEPITLSVILIGAIVSATINTSIQLYNNGGNFNKINWTSVGVSALAGAVGGVAGFYAGAGITAVTGYTSGAIYGAGVGLAGGAAGGFVQGGFGDGSGGWNWNNAWLGAGLGAAGGAVFGFVASGLVASWNKTNFFTGKAKLQPSLPTQTSSSGNNSTTGNNPTNDAQIVVKRTAQQQRAYDLMYGKTPTDYSSQINLTYKNTQNGVFEQLRLFGKRNNQFSNHTDFKVSNYSPDEIFNTMSKGLEVNYFKNGNGMGVQFSDGVKMNYYYNSSSFPGHPAIELVNPSLKKGFQTYLKLRF